jgi:hypothetical protein
MLQINGPLKLGPALKDDEVDEALKRDDDDVDNISDTESCQLVGKFSPDNLDMVDGGIFCLPIVLEKGVFYTEDGAMTDEAWTTTCLALVPCGDYDIYQRVGLARNNDSKWFENERTGLIIVRFTDRFLT